MEIEEKVLKLIKSRKKGILQNELWKKAEIDRRKCSRVVEKLEKEGIIFREHEATRGTRTYRITLTEKKEKKKVRDFRLLLVKDMFAPCTGCAIECTPEQCIPLSEWVFHIIEEQ